MGLVEEHGALHGTPTEQALLVALEHDTPTINTLRQELGEAEGEEAFVDLKRRGYISSEQSLAAEAVLTSAGQRLAEFVLESRARGGADRADGVRRLILRWVVQNPGSSSLDDLRQTGPEVFGALVQTDEFEEEADWLMEKQLLKVIATAEDPYLRPEITGAGRRVLQIPDQTIEDQLSGAGSADRRSYTNTFHGATTIGAFAQGDQNIISVMMTSGQLAEASSVLAQLEALPEVQNQPELTEAVGAIRGELASPEPQKEGILAKVGTAFGVAMANGSAPMVLQLLGQLPQVFS